MSHTKPIKLGHELHAEIIGPASIPDVLYPELHIGDSEDERLLDLPDEGTAEIKFRVKRRTHREEAQGDSKKKRRCCSITLEVISLEPGHDPKFNGKKKTHWEMFNGGR
jgi:hypothetical protein